MPRSNLRLALLACAFPFFATAETVQLDETVQVDEVVVGFAKPPPGVTALPGTGPVKDYVARDSYTPTKIGAKLIETPQAVSVVGAQQIRDLSEQNLGQAMEFVSGVLPSTFGFDTRNDFYLIRGFPGQVSGCLLDGLQLYSNSFATFRVKPAIWRSPSPPCRPRPCSKTSSATTARIAGCSCSTSAAPCSPACSSSASQWR